MSTTLSGDQHIKKVSKFFCLFSDRDHSLAKKPMSHHSECPEDRRTSEMQCISECLNFPFYFTYMHIDLP